MFNAKLFSETVRAKIAEKGETPQWVRNPGYYSLKFYKVINGFEPDLDMFWELCKWADLTDRVKDFFVDNPADLDEF